MTVSEAARALIAKLDTLSSRDPHWEFEKEADDLRGALEEEKKAAENFRKQFTQSGGTQAAPTGNYEVWN